MTYHTPLNSTQEFFDNKTLSLKLTNNFFSAASLLGNLK